MNFIGALIFTANLIKYKKYVLFNGCRYRL